MKTRISWIVSCVLLLSSHAMASAMAAEASRHRHEAESIGSATMKSDRTIVLHLRAESGPNLGDAVLEFDPKDPKYSSVLEHLGGLEPGQTKAVPPWPSEQTRTPRKPRKTEADPKK